MCFGGSKPAAPAIISPPDPANDPIAKAQIKEAQAKEKERNLKRKGRSKTIITSGLGVNEPAETSTKTLLGA